MMKQRCDAYASRLIGDDTIHTDLFHRLLVQSFPENTGPPKRKPSITVRGQPLIFSLKYDGNAPQTRLRTVMEPGGNGLSVAEQVDFCLRLLNAVIQDYQWEIGQDLNQILPIIYPAHPDETTEWVGGMWIGMESGGVPALKIYLPLHAQAAQRRWQKIASILALFSRKEVEPVFRTLMHKTQDAGAPLGLGCVVDARGLRGIRIYLSFAGLCAENMSALCRSFEFTGTEQSAAFFEAVQTLPGSGPSSVLAVDFLLGEDGFLLPDPYRLKAEVSLCNMDEQQQAVIEPFFGRLLEQLQFSTGAFWEDMALVRTYFPNRMMQYCSIGVGRKDTHLSLYFEPTF